MTKPRPTDADLQALLRMVAHFHISPELPADQRMIAQCLDAADALDESTADYVRYLKQLQAREEAAGEADTPENDAKWRPTAPTLGEERKVPWVAALNRCRSGHPDERFKPCDECRYAVTFPSPPQTPDDAQDEASPQYFDAGVMGDPRD